MILHVDAVHSYYGKSHILQGVSMTLPQGTVVTLLGRNGAGKSTTLKTIAGVIAPKAGAVRFGGRDIAGQPAHKIAAMGVCLVPEHRGIFKLLTVEENLKLGMRRDSPWQLEDIYRIFPRLKERRRNGGGQLSGGEQQMLAIGRALMNHPRVLMLDEPVEGLAPVIVEEIVAQIQSIKRAGVTILLVEQNLEVCTQLADHHFIIEQGTIVYEGSNADFMADENVKDRYLGVGV
ncbi:ABC transporter ATP-binding protein [Achromobacter denitrificans]|jgi:branched-chain amino acid transport system ATP-binding protein|uniref:ABC transporter ATP-binding protein n=1 Tax=Achromobacter denitrificans TaxID=32002 RepID=A0A427WWC9_ACHDE|nr:MULTISPECIES: ABC transporter ATP-binding protein [Achromobacter]ASC66671.1 ABC transporter ATP-binding protein [Achromobacter denitrificans]MBV2161903.1 ABC transporter ATP-binding protein [Achromobacter denitrificans]MDF3852527.1 ABC transporter ATP-binding protein [Achromobacter denitrificans]MDF3862646.1 ABC transporter ATP-binding protein [Achromobacter denitrificans]MDX3879877.1 ABC transporter ATP-binding protein [Achromobacter sp.]